MLVNKKEQTKVERKILNTRKDDNMKDARKYFEKTGNIYGVSTKYGFGKWTGYAKKFTSFEEAEKWLHTEEYDFRERELCSKTEAKKWGYKE